MEVYKQDPEQVDILITDQTMPDMTGIQLITEMHKSGAKLPILLCTGYSDNVTEQSAEDLGINRILMKPITITDLAWAVHEVLLIQKMEMIPKPVAPPVNSSRV